MTLFLGVTAGRQNLPLPMSTADEGKEGLPPTNPVPVTAGLTEEQQRKLDAAEKILAEREQELEEIKNPSTEQAMQEVRRRCDSRRFPTGGPRVPRGRAPRAGGWSQAPCGSHIRPGSFA